MMKKILILLAVVSMVGIASANSMGVVYDFDSDTDGQPPASQWNPAANCTAVVSNPTGTAGTLLVSTTAPQGWNSTYSYWYDIKDGYDYTLTFDFVSTTAGNVIARFVGAGLAANFDGLSSLGTNSFTARATADLGTLTLQLGGFGEGATHEFDNISMTETVPEPATMVLLGLGGMLIRRKR